MCVRFAFDFVCSFVWFLVLFFICIQCVAVNSETRLPLDYIRVCLNLQSVMFKATTAATTTTTAATTTSATTKGGPRG